MSASNERLGNLHALFTAYWEIRFAQASHAVADERIPMTAAELSVVRAFLKDNSIFGDVDASGDLDDLAKKLKGQLTGSVTSDELDDIMSRFHAETQNLINGMPH